MREDLVVVLQRHVKAENAHDMDGTLVTLHPDCVFEDIATGQTFAGRAGARAYYRQWWDAFGLVFSREPTGKAYWTEDGTYIAEGRFHGRHVGPFLDSPPSGKSVEFRFLVIVAFRDGLMLSERFYYDLRGLLRQIGVADVVPWFAAVPGRWRPS